MGAVKLFAVLAASIGKVSASSELKWMQQALQTGLPKGFPSTDLETMVQRRIKHEPLQYILGVYVYHLTVAW
jgi:hypothetical protein